MKYLVYIILAAIILTAAHYWGDTEHTKAYWTGFMVAGLLDLAWNTGKALSDD